jgi:NADP-dependent 3-hydroxy acid dehydrogenase YdfG
VSDPDLCVVVGATGAIGSAVTSRLTRRGLRVLAVARRSAELDQAEDSHGGLLTCAVTTLTVRR